MKNRIELLDGGVVRIWLYQEGMFAVVDQDDFDLINGPQSWSLHSQGYAVRQIWRNNRQDRCEYLHRVILQAPPDMQVDHIDRDRLNCRRSNLRLATPVGNARNKSIVEGNTSGARGVSWDKVNGRWRAYLNLNDRQVHLGRFDSFDEAVEARLKAEAEVYGAFAPGRK